MLFRRLDAGETVVGEKINTILAQLETVLETLGRVTVGPGLECRRGSMGVGISIAASLMALIEDAAEGGSDEQKAEDELKYGFFARITGSSDYADNIWAYTFERVTKGSEAHSPGAWLTGDLTGTAYNTIESINGAIGVQGNGVDVDGADFPIGFSIQPCPTGNIVVMKRVELSTDQFEYWFSYENGVDGTCD